MMIRWWIKCECNEDSLMIELITSHEKYYMYDVELNDNSCIDGEKQMMLIIQFM